MPELSVIIPYREADEALSLQTQKVCESLGILRRAYEVICVEYGSRSEGRKTMQTSTNANLKTLSLTGGRDVSSAISAGVAVAGGEAIVVMEAGGQYAPEQIDWLTERLARADIVFGRRRFNRARKWWTGFTQIPRRLLLGLEARDPDCLFWAARREAIVGLELGRGMHRFLASLVSMRGFRVTEIHIDHRSRWPAWPGPALGAGNLLAVWWLKRGRESYRAHERGETKNSWTTRRYGIDTEQTACVQRPETKSVSKTAS